jgi:hypothetical protein
VIFDVSEDLMVVGEVTIFPRLSLMCISHVVKAPTFICCCGKTISIVFAGAALMLMLRL